MITYRHHKRAETISRTQIYLAFFSISAYYSDEVEREKAMLERKAQNFFNNPRLIRKFGIKLAYLFGSAADGRFTARSDLDIAVLFAASRRSQDILQKSALLQIELHRYISGPIDFVILNFASPLLKHEVINGKNLFAEYEKVRREFERQTEVEYKKFEKNLNSKFKRKLPALT